MEWARGAEPAGLLRIHAAGCAECARFLEEQQALSGMLACLASEEIPSAEESIGRALAEFDRSRHNARVRVLGWFAAGAVAAAACLTLMVTPSRAPAPLAVRQPQFVPIPYTVPLAPEERVTVVRMEIPVAALLAAGFDVPAADPGATVQADVVVSQDGRARAISVLSTN